MNQKKVEALWGSLEKWLNILQNGASDNGMEDCTCCKVFYKRTGAPCVGCPIAIHTGSPYCGDTPYVAWDEHYNMYGPDQRRVIGTEHERDMALEEYLFVYDVLMDELDG